MGVSENFLWLRDKFCDFISDEWSMSFAVLTWQLCNNTLIRVFLTRVLIKWQSLFTDNHSYSNLYIPLCQPEASPCNVSLYSLPFTLPLRVVIHEKLAAAAARRLAFHDKSPIPCQKGDTFYGDTFYAWHFSARTRSSIHSPILHLISVKPP